LDAHLVNAARRVTSAILFDPIGNRILIQDSRHCQPIPRVIHAEQYSRHCVDRGASPEERRHWDEQFRSRLWCLARRCHFPKTVVAPTTFAHHSKLQAYCLRSRGFAPRSTAALTVCSLIAVTRYFWSSH